MNNQRFYFFVRCFFALTVTMILVTHQTPISAYAFFPTESAINTLMPPLQSSNNLTFTIVNETHTAELAPHLTDAAKQSTTLQITNTETLETGGEQVPPPSDDDVVINEVVLIDLIVQWFAYAWMAVGIGLILAVLLIFIYLQIRGHALKRKSSS